MTPHDFNRRDLIKGPRRRRLRRVRPSLRIGDAGPMGSILIHGEPGADFAPALMPNAGDVVVAKPGKGAFNATTLSEALTSRHITHLIFGGVTIGVRVQTTMRDAYDRGHECLLVEEATGSYFPGFKEHTLAHAGRSGPEAGA